MKQILRMAAYCRVSTKKEAQLDSLSHQKEFFAEYAEKEGMKLAAVYADEGVSGRQLHHREQFLRMLEDAEKDMFDLLVVKDISRFARNTVDCLQAIRTLKKLGISVRFISCGQESLGESEFILTVYASLAQEESANLSKRIKFGKDINAKKGRVPPFLYGYDRVDNFHLRRNPEEADVIQQIYSAYLDGEGTAYIATRLNEQGHRTKKGKKWDSRGVRRCLQNPIYCGILVNHKSTVTDFLDGTVQNLPEAEHYYHYRPEWAIVSQRDFQAVQTERERRRKLYGKACGTNRNT
ncbi:MAG: recombinase family protein [Clostridia bacterium]|nr:recombinase family protein [Clostridia bacterium]